MNPGVRELRRMLAKWQPYSTLHDHTLSSGSVQASSVLVLTICQVHCFPLDQETVILHDLNSTIDAQASSSLDSVTFSLSSFPFDRNFDRK